MDNSHSRRARAVRFFQRVHEISRTGDISDPLTATIMFEALGAEVVSGGKRGLTPATLSRSQGLPQETARRRLASLAAKGMLEKRRAQYYVPRESDYWPAFDRIVEELEELVARTHREVTSLHQGTP